MSNFVYSGAKWVCSMGGNGILRSDSKVCISGKGILTEFAVPCPTGGVCMLNNNIPCAPKSPSWNKVTLSQSVSCENKKALLSSSTFTCSGTGMGKILPQPCKADNMPMLSANTDISAKISPETDDKPSNNKIIQPDKSENADNPKNINSMTDIAEKNIPSASDMRKNHLCSGKCPKEFEKNCKFRTASCETLIHPNSSERLGNNTNSDAARELFNSFRYGLTVDYHVAPTAAAHHIVPGNECLARYKLLVRLANFFDYDVNCAENGINLPTFSGAFIQENEKPRTYYYFMSKITAEIPENEFSGSQLHIGQHTYELRRLKKLHPEYSVCMTYEQIVRNMLSKLENHYIDTSDGKCFMQNTEKEKQSFFSAMNRISSDIRRKIKLFPQGKRTLSVKNLPVCVSFPSLLYDLGITEEEYGLISK
ncbi:MAG: AHH domain-containing protein [Ruminococcus sp.]|nr:AHH domain-containing protein [Ruminococcus sp.]